MIWVFLPKWRNLEPGWFRCSQRICCQTTLFLSGEPMERVEGCLRPQRSCRILPACVRSDSLRAGCALWWSAFGRRAGACAGFFSKTFRSPAGNRSFITGQEKKIRDLIRNYTVKWCLITLYSIYKWQRGNQELEMKRSFTHLWLFTPVQVVFCSISILFK